MEAKRAQGPADSNSKYVAEIASNSIALAQQLAAMEEATTRTAYAHLKAVQKTRFLSSNIEAEPIQLASERLQIERETARRIFWAALWRMPVYGLPGAIMVGLVWSWPVAIAWGLCGGGVGFLRALDNV
ncbi:MAG: hypothetical protein AAF329_00415 [Cyanobacteria bacterium P01_A01_bin.17]